MRLIKTLAAGALSSLSLACFAGPTLDFEGVGNGKQVLDFYAGQGITFDKNAVAFVSAKTIGALGGLFTNTPSPSTAITVLTGPDDDNFSFLINITGGFQTSLGLSFGTQRGAFGDVTLYSEADGKGNAIRFEELLQAEDAQRDCKDQVFGDLICVWTLADIDFSGTAYSVRVSSSAAGLMFIDNMRFGTAEPGNNVPEPASLALALAAAGAVALSRRRKPATNAA